jgi:drug/metabolite transporter (DMT)-like permease
VRYLFQTVVTGMALWPMRGSAFLKTKRPGLQFLRGLLLFICSAIAFLSLRFMPVGEFTAIVMISPLIITAISAWKLHDRVSALRWLCVVGGFAGSLAVIRPGGESFHWAMLLPCVLVMANTAFQVLTSRLARTDNSGTMHFYTGLVGLVLASLALPFIWQAMPWSVWALLLLIAAFGTLGHFLLILAYARAPIAVLTPYLYLQIGFSTLGGWLIFSHMPDAWALAGIALVSASGAFGTWLTAREQRV